MTINELSKHLEEIRSEHGFTGNEEVEISAYSVHHMKYESGPVTKVHVALNKQKMVIQSG